MHCVVLVQIARLGQQQQQQQKWLSNYLALYSTLILSLSFPFGSLCQDKKSGRPENKIKMAME